MLRTSFAGRNHFFALKHVFSSFSATNEKITRRKCKNGTLSIYATVCTFYCQLIYFYRIESFTAIPQYAAQSSKMVLNQSCFRSRFVVTSPLLVTRIFSPAGNYIKHEPWKKIAVDLGLSFFLFCHPSGFLPVVGPTEWWCLRHLARPCYVALGRALICGYYPETL